MRKILFVLIGLLCLISASFMYLLMTTGFVSVPPAPAVQQEVTVTSKPSGLPSPIVPPAQAVPMAFPPAPLAKKHSLPVKKEEVDATSDAGPRCHQQQLMQGGGSVMVCDYD